MLSANNCWPVFQIDSQKIDKPETYSENNLLHWGLWPFSSFNRQSEFIRTPDGFRPQIGLVLEVGLDLCQRNRGPIYLVFIQFPHFVPTSVEGTPRKYDFRSRARKTLWFYKDGFINYEGHPWTWFVFQRLWWPFGYWSFGLTNSAGAWWWYAIRWFYGWLKTISIWWEPILSMGPNIKRIRSTISRYDRSLWSKAFWVVDSNIATTQGASIEASMRGWVGQPMKPCGSAFETNRMFSSRHEHCAWNYCCQPL